MSQGLQVRDANGVELFSTSSLPFRAMGMFTTTNANGSIALPIAAKGQFAYFSRPTILNATQIPLHPMVSWSNGVASWTFPVQNMWAARDIIRVPSVVYWGVQDV